MLLVRYGQLVLSDASEADLAHIADVVNRLDIWLVSRASVEGSRDTYFGADTTTQYMTRLPLGSLRFLRVESLLTSTSYDMARDVKFVTPNDT